MVRRCAVGLSLAVLLGLAPTVVAQLPSDSATQQDDGPTRAWFSLGLGAAGVRYSRESPSTVGCTLAVDTRAWPSSALPFARPNTIGAIVALRTRARG
jgi:hypothetical protein